MSACLGADGQLERGGTLASGNAGKDVLVKAPRYLDVM